MVGFSDLVTYIINTFSTCPPLPSLPPSLSLPPSHPVELTDNELASISRDILARLAEDSFEILQSSLCIPDHLMVSEVDAQETVMGRMIKMLKIWCDMYCGEQSKRDALAICLRRSDPRLVSTAQRLQFGWYSWSPYNTGIATLV